MIIKQTMRIFFNINFSQIIHFPTGIIHNNFNLKIFFPYPSNPLLQKLLISASSSVVITFEPETPE